MLKNRPENLKGFTIVELMTTIVVAVIVILGIGFIVADSHRGWNKMYNRVYGDVVTDGYVARKTFDVVIRKASKENFLLDDNGDWVEVYYYADSDSTVLDRYARFYEGDGSLNVEYGQLNPRETLSVETICDNVSDCVFKGIGGSVQMCLRLDNGSEAITVTSSAVLHN